MGTGAWQFDHHNAVREALSDRERRFFGENSRQASMFFSACSAAVRRWHSRGVISDHSHSVEAALGLARGVGLLHQLTQEGLPHLKDFDYPWYPASVEEVEDAVLGRHASMKALSRGLNQPDRYIQMLRNRGSLVREFSIPLYADSEKYEPITRRHMSNVGWKLDAADPLSLPRRLIELSSGEPIRGDVYHRAARAYGVPNKLADLVAAVLDSGTALPINEVRGLRTLSRVDVTWGTFGPPREWRNRREGLVLFGQVVARDGLAGVGAFNALRGALDSVRIPNDTGVTENAGSGGGQGEPNVTSQTSGLYRTGRPPTPEEEALATAEWNQSSSSRESATEIGGAQESASLSTSWEDVDDREPARVDYGEEWVHPEEELLEEEWLEDNLARERTEDTGWFEY